MTAVFSGEGTSVWPLPVFLSGKIQQCFCSMPGNTFQETTREVVEERERERGVGGGGGGGDVNITAAQSR